MPVAMQTMMVMGAPSSEPDHMMQACEGGAGEGGGASTTTTTTTTTMAKLIRGKDEVEFERDETERNLFFHTLLKHVIAQLSASAGPHQRYTLKRETRDGWTVMGEYPVRWVEFKVQHTRVFVVTHPAPVLATKSMYSIELLLPEMGLKVEEIPLMPTTTPEHVLSALMRLSSAMFQPRV
jgi:hypothetical protein